MMTAKLITKDGFEKFAEITSPPPPTYRALVKPKVGFGEDSVSREGQLPYIDFTLDTAQSTSDLAVYVESVS